MNFSDGHLAYKVLNLATLLTEHMMLRTAIMRELKYDEILNQ